MGEHPQGFLRGEALGGEMGDGSREEGLDLY
jgi:hypothetical protein